MTFRVTYTTQQTSVKIRNEQLNEYNTHTHTHLCNNAADQEKERWEHW